MKHCYKVILEIREDSRREVEAGPGYYEENIVAHSAPEAIAAAVRRRHSERPDTAASAVTVYLCERIAWNVVS